MGAKHLTDNRNNNVSKYKPFRERFPKIWRSLHPIEKQIIVHLEWNKGATPKELQEWCRKPPNRIETWKDGKEHFVWRDRKGRWAKRHYSLRTIQRHINELPHQCHIIRKWPLYHIAVNPYFPCNPKSFSSPPAIFSLLFPFSFSSCQIAYGGVITEEEALTLVRVLERGYLTSKWGRETFHCSTKEFMKKIARLRRFGILKPFSWNTEYHPNCSYQAWYLNPAYYDVVEEWASIIRHRNSTENRTSNKNDKISRNRKIQDKNWKRSSFWGSLEHVNNFDKILKN